jgi:protein TonB
VSSPNPLPKDRAPAEGADGKRRPGENIRHSLAWSGLLHATLAGLLVVSALLSHRGEKWGGAGGGGGAVQLKLVGSMPAIPLPTPNVVTTSRVVDVTHGLYKSEPPPKIPFQHKATKLPEFQKEKRPVWKTPRKSRILKDKSQPPPNAVPYGQGGTPNVPTSSFTLGDQTQGGMSMAGPSGGFGQRFPWYVAAVRRRISSNWLQATVSPTIRWAPRAVINFEILRDGTIVNIQVMKSSGYPSVDASAVRAIQSSSPLNSLPGSYSGSYVDVEFWFDFRR